ncbi:MAG: type VI secretion system contractile sheath small subunit [Deltaproteobacteria bacterium]|jgi:type VI secretion system protein ImpB|nr:type VI secretion system contractile sheath small subunit [Deltaproteobacteria bacterium]
MAQDTGKTVSNRVNIVYNSSRDDKFEVELPFKALVLGDFIGAEDAAPLSEREAIPINAGNFDAVMRAVAPRVEISVRDMLTGEEDSRIPVTLRFGSLADLAPKRLSESIEPLREALDLRGRLLAARKAVEENPGLAGEVNGLLSGQGARGRLLEALKSGKAPAGGGQSSGQRRPTKA